MPAPAPARRGCVPRPSVPAAPGLLLLALLATAVTGAVAKGGAAPDSGPGLPDFGTTLPPPVADGTLGGGQPAQPAQRPFIAGGGTGVGEAVLSEMSGAARLVGGG